MIDASSSRAQYSEDCVKISCYGFYVHVHYTLYPVIRTCMGLAGSESMAVQCL